MICYKWILGLTPLLLLLLYLLYMDLKSTHIRYIHLQVKTYGPWFPFIGTVV